MSTSGFGIHLVRYKRLSHGVKSVAQEGRGKLSEAKGSPPYQGGVRGGDFLPTGEPTAPLSPLLKGGNQSRSIGTLPLQTASIGTSLSRTHVMKILRGYPNRCSICGFDYPPRCGELALRGDGEWPTGRRIFFDGR